MGEAIITPIEGKVFGAVVTGIRLSELTNASFARLEQAFLEFGFLVFPDQHLSIEENIAFGRRFGELEFGGVPMTNLTRDGGIYGVESQHMRTSIGNEAWHTDSTFWPVSSKCSMLSAAAVPDAGGQTELADMRAGYSALDETTRKRIEGLSAYHSALFSQANDLGDFPEQKEEGFYHAEAYLRPLVKTHPRTGRKSLFVGLCLAKI